MTRTSDYNRLAASRPADRQTAEVAPLAPQDGQPWSSVILGLTEQLAVAEGEARRLNEQIAALGYAIPAGSGHPRDPRHRLSRQLEHYEAIAADLKRELRRANGVTKPRAKSPKRRGPGGRHSGSGIPGHYHYSTPSPGA
jgi:hypothetical protein